MECSFKEIKVSSLQAQTAWDKLDPESTRVGGYWGAPVVAVGVGDVSKLE